MKGPIYGRHANINLRIYLLYPREKLLITFNNELIFSDSAYQNKEKYNYEKYLKARIKNGGVVSLKTIFHGKPIIDTSIKVIPGFEKYILQLSAPFPSNISEDSLKKLKVPYKFGYIPIENSRRIVTLEPDTVKHFLN
ncbi:hypothetical protein ACDQ55_16605 [Chitinophaga sp. 30R24]|uniref:hypothetical protein n=1 Tax=Chitinophaga sp. 30R24 TaxID=3248838 RepID=UPI003B90FA48